MSEPSSSESQAPPLVQGSPLFGSARALRDEPIATYERAMLLHGDLVRFRVGPPRVGFEFDALFRPELARQVLATDFGRYSKQAPVFSEMIRFLGEGLLTSEGDRWRRDRRILQPLFTRRRVASYVERIAAAADDLVASWRPDARAGRPVDLHASSMHYALDALGRAVLGDDVAGARTVLQGALQVLSEHAIRRALALVRVPPSVPSPANLKARRTQAALYGLVDGLIARRRAAGEPGDDLLGLLLAARDPESGAGISDRDVRDQVLVFLLGGHETTGAALAFTLHLLAAHPDVQERVRSEVTAVLGERAPGDDDVEDLHYTTQVVDEALRMYPPGHILVRSAARPARLGGHRVPKGRIVVISIWGIHHNPSVWPDPYRFDPDRFSVEGPEVDRAAHHTRYAHLPFGGGPRACIGSHLAVTELVIAVAVVLRAFRLRALVKDLTLDVGLSLQPLGTLPCRLEQLGTT